MNKSGTEKGARFYITTPIYYVNDDPHIGHSYTNIACDTLARYNRLKGREVFFLTGTDEHGQKIERQANEAGKQPAEFVEQVVPRFISLWEKLSITNDDFVRTTQERHVRTVRKVLTQLYEKGAIYKAQYDGAYCTPCETFLPRLQLEEMKCPDCGRPLEDIREDNYFLKLSAHQDYLVNHIKNNSGFIMPVSRRNEVLKFLENPLQDLCISRPKHRLRWGIELPFDEDYVTYVWVDALVNYISAIGYADSTEQFRKFWPADIHVIGKDILRPHAVYWPIMLKFLGLEPPRKIFAHGWWTVEGKKMSKSKGNVVDPVAVVDRFGREAYRYFLLREVTFGSDGDYSEEALVKRLNSDLANDIGNLVNRTLGLMKKYSGSSVPSPAGDEDPGDRDLKEKVNRLGKTIEENIQIPDFGACLEEIRLLANRANKYIEEQAPWALARQGSPRLNAVIYNVAETVRAISTALLPFLPDTSLKMAEQIGAGGYIRSCSFDDALRWGVLESGLKAREAVPLFPRIEK